MDRLSDYDYTLPDEAIAQTPLADRSAARLLHLDPETGAVRHRAFRDVVDILAPGDLLVTNDTRVTALRLFGHRPSGGAVEALLLRETSAGTYEALVKPAKRLKPGSPVHFGDGIDAEVVGGEGPVRELRFLGPADVQAAGQVPLPPYIRASLADPERYQTVYARVPGSAAAPTAGLHFTPEILEALRAKGVRVASVTLDVGLDTFRPVQVENLADHPMHGERCSLPEETRDAIAACSGRIVAVGTTAARTLESFAVGPRKMEAGEMTTSIFIRPGYRFRIVDGMFTNFHMPRTTMLAMISALAGRERIMSAYQEALREGYRFLSFGDSMLILAATPR